MVQSARIAAPMTSPLSAFSPDGRSSANTGRPQLLTASMASASGARTALFSPVPSSASTMTSADVELRRLEIEDAPATGAKILGRPARITTQLHPAHDSASTVTERPAAWANRAST